MSEASRPAHESTLARRIGVWALAVSSVVVAAAFPALLLAYPGKGLAPRQPIPFSHRIHAGVKGIDCAFCHPLTERSPRAGIPEVGKCLFCHGHVIPEHPWILRLKRHMDEGDPIPWKRVVYLPDHVSFSHQPHILAGLDCAECHGEVRGMDRIPARDFKMGDCVDCHRAKKAELGCWQACHR